MAHADYVHCIEGRLRVRSRSSDPHQRARARIALLAMPGVTSVTESARTGSLLVYYDAEKIGGRELIALLVRRRFLECEPADLAGRREPVTDALRDLLAEPRVQRALRALARLALDRYLPGPMGRVLAALI
jgi:hypothetical protein